MELNSKTPFLRGENDPSKFLSGDGSWVNDTKDNTVSFTSDDTASPTSFTTIDVVASGEKHSSLMQKLSQAVKNIRWLNSNKRTTGAFDSKSDTVTFTTADVSSDSSATSWTSVSQLTSGLTHATLLNRISAMMKNVRFLYRTNVVTATNVDCGHKYLSLSNITMMQYGRLKIFSATIKTLRAINIGGSVSDYVYFSTLGWSNYSPIFGTNDSYKRMVVGSSFNCSNHVTSQTESYFLSAQGAVSEYTIEFYIANHSTGNSYNIASNSELGTISIMYV